MLICPKCKYEQDTGKFCGVCGETLQQLQSDQTVKQVEQVNSEHSQTAATTVTQPQQAQAQPQASVDITNEVSLYGSYFLNLLKNPTKALHLNESHFLYGIINMILFVIAFSLSLYSLINAVYKSSIGLIAPSLPFFDIFFRIGFIVAIFIVIGFLSTFFMAILSTKQTTFKVLIAQYGGIIVPFIVLNILALLTGLSGSIVFTLILLGTSLVFCTFIIPALIVFEKGSNTNMHTQKVYLSISSSAIAMLAVYIVVRNILGNFFEYIEQIADTISYF